ncbi:MAG: hypothetical protein RL398_44 [Planctomycetota bacterium]
MDDQGDVALGVPGSGLSGLDRFLPPAKSIVARRFVAAGKVPEEHEFVRRGLMLSPREKELLAHWLAAGLVTKVVEEVRAADGTVKLGIELPDGKRIETVAMTVGAVCVSTQVGCAVGCRFCASGMFGVERHLQPDEIVEQVVHARRYHKLDRVVFMGMGEPTHNLDNVLTAVARLRHEVLISGKRQTLSTVGGLKPIARMLEAEVRPSLAVSLHLADERRRLDLLPRAYRDPLPEIVAAADAYGREVGNPVQFEWTLLAGVNDSDDDVDQLCELVRGTRAYVNFIVYNQVEGLPFAAPPRERIVEIVRRVKKAGILATIRDSAGPDAQAACGQLRLRDRVRA